ncbi:MAG: Mrp/NBP35 family ATP-binding protein, partial [Cytophagales bacterium]|nr:Mrp/NBP35 family ATP-binding protein [Cytophagales bacterium]
MKISVEDRIWNALRTVEDPDLKKDLVTLGMIKDLQVEEKKISFVLELTTPACPLKELLRKRCEEAIRTELNEDVVINIRFSSRVRSAVGKDKSTLLPGVKHVIAISSGKGGVGKSTLAANLALALAQEGAKVGLVDADIFGPSIPLMFNCEGERPEVIEVEGKHMLVPADCYGVGIISMGMLVSSEQAMVWRGPMASSALKQLVQDTKWGERDYLLVDLPPGTSDIPLTLAQTFPLSGVVVVSTPQQLALSDVRKGIAMFRKPEINVSLLGLIENMSYFSPPDMPDKRYYIFGKDGGKNLAAELSIPFLGEIPIYSSIQSSGDSGYPVGLKPGEASHIFLELARKLAQQLSIQTVNSTEPVSPQH